MEKFKKNKSILVAKIQKQVNKVMELLLLLFITITIIRVVSLVIQYLPDGSIYVREQKIVIIITPIIFFAF